MLPQLDDTRIPFVHDMWLHKGAAVIKSSSGASQERTIMSQERDLWRKARLQLQGPREGSRDG